MSNEEKTNETDTSTASPSKSSKLTQDDALSKLEEYRCAICQNIIINACRIDCGHTFCRHCLNVDRENRNHGTKPTCFICDAAVTEIIQNAERDKEIEDLYAILPTTERLRRARTKSERKVEEDNFRKIPKETGHSNNEQHEQSSNDSAGSGDAISFNNATSDAWSCENSNYSSDSQREPPTLYVGAPFTLWESDNGYDIPADNTGEHYSDDSEETNAINNGLGFTQLRPPPMVIHHTIQHVYHTVEVRNSECNDDVDDTRRESNTNLRPRPSQQSTEWRHYSDSMSHFSEPEHFNIASNPHSSFRVRDLPVHNNHDPFSSCRNTTGRFTTGYHHQCNPYYGYPYHAQPHLHPPIYISAMAMPYRLEPYCVNNSSSRNHLFESGDNSSNFHCNHRQNFHYHNGHHDHGPTIIPNARARAASTTAFHDEEDSSETPFHFHEPSYESENGNASDEEYNNDRDDFCHEQTDCFECDGLCEFHQRVELRPLHERRLSNERILGPSSFTRRARSYEVLHPHPISNNAVHFTREPCRTHAEEECLRNETDDEDHHVITFRISVPTNPRIERNDDEIERQTSSTGLPDLRI